MEQDVNHVRAGVVQLSAAAEVGQDVVDAPVGAGRYRRRHRLVSDRAERLGEPGTTASVGGAYRAVRHRTITGRGTPAAVSLTHTS